MGTEAQERAPLPTEDETERDASFHVFVDVVTPEDRPTNNKTAPVTPRRSEQLLVYGVVASTPVHVEETLNNLVLETLTASYKRVQDRVSVALRILVPQTVRKVLK